MAARQRTLSRALFLGAGVVLGWAVAQFQPVRLQADRSTPGGDDLLTAGPVSISRDRGNDIQVEHNAIYYLDYRGGRLLASVPTHRETTGGSQILGTFAERDLVADFKLTPGASTPHFMMTTGTLGSLNGAWAPLFVFETTSKQVATYRVIPQIVGTVSRPRFDLLELRSIAAVPAPAAAPGH